MHVEIGNFATGDLGDLLRDSEKNYESSQKVAKDLEIYRKRSNGRGLRTKHRACKENKIR